MTKITTAYARANIALAKYWGKRDVALNLPATGSLSITLAELVTRTTVAFDPALQHDVVVLNGRDALSAKFTTFLDLVRQRAGSSLRARVETQNNFPTGAGLASSASGFAALALAATSALGLQLSLRELSALARRGSGSAARSIFGGFVQMHIDDPDPYAEQILTSEAWPLRVLIAITSEAQKDILSTDGMLHTENTSPLYGGWLASWRDDVTELRAAVLARDFAKVADVSEHSCLKMHATMLAAKPGLIYWNARTLALVHWVRSLRKQGVPVFFTIDAGPQVKLVCLPEAVNTVRAALDPDLRIIETGLGQGASLES